MGALSTIIIWKAKTSAETEVRRSFNETSDFGVPFQVNIANWTLWS